MMQMVTLIDRQPLALHQGKVVKSGVYSQILSAQECVTRAKRYAEQIKAGIDEEAEQARKRGYEAGFAQAQEEFAQRMVSTVIRLENAHIALEAHLVNTVMQALQTVLGSLDESLVLEKLVRQCIRAAGQERHLSLRVSVEQFEAVNRILSSLLSDYSHIEFIDVLKDPHLKKDSCVLETEYGAVDGSLHMHLKAIRQGLIDAFVGRRPASNEASQPQAKHSVGSYPC